MGMIKKFLAKNLSNAIEKADRDTIKTPSIFDFSKIKRLGVLQKVESHSEAKLFLKTSEQLQKAGYKVKILGWTPVSLKKNEDWGIPLFSNKENNWRGVTRFKNPLISDFIKSEFDLILNLHSNFCTPLDLIVANTKSLWKAGPSSLDSMVYDLMVEGAVDINYWFQLMKKVSIKNEQPVLV
jgi:hypothetical protein